MRGRMDPAGRGGWGRPNLNRSLLHPKQEGWSKLPHGPTPRRWRADPDRLDNGFPVDGRVDQ
jgi:hypothetical protein